MQKIRSWLINSISNDWESLHFGKQVNTKTYHQCFALHPSGYQKSIDEEHLNWHASQLCFVSSPSVSLIQLLSAVILTSCKRSVLLSIEDTEQGDPENIFIGNKKSMKTSKENVYYSSNREVCILSSLNTRACMLFSLVVLVAISRKFHCLNHFKQT